MIFPCTSCGCCCRRIANVVNSLKLNDKSHPLYFPHKIDKNGKCEHFENNKCNIYLTRPLICNIEKFAEEFNLDKSNFYSKNIVACNKMMDEDNVPLAFRIEEI